MSDLWRFAPLVPFTETLSFLTDVQQALLAESRVSVRHARMVYQMRHRLDDAANLEAEGIFDANRTGFFRVPAWGEMTEFSASVAPGATTLAVADADWRVGGEVFLSGPSRQVEAIEITDVEPGLITLASATTIPVRIAAPLRQCKALSPLGGTRMFRGLSERVVTFVTQDNIDLAAMDFDTVDALPVINDAYEIAGGVEQAMVHPVETIDNGVGGVAPVALRAGADHRLGVFFTDDGAAAMWRRRQFWHAMRGRASEFWLPSFADDLELADPVGASDLTVRLAAPAWAASLLVGRVLVLDDGGGRLARKATGVTVDGAEWVVSVAGSFGRSIAATARVSIARRMRLDVDDVALTYPRVGMMQSGAVCVGVP